MVLISYYNKIENNKIKLDMEMHGTTLKRKRIPCKFVANYEH